MTLGNFYVSFNRLEDAEKQFIKGIETDPKRIPSYLHLGDFYLAWGKKEKAIETFKKAVDIDSKNIPARARLAEIFLNDKKYTEASEDDRKDPRSWPKESRRDIAKRKITLGKAGI